MHQFARVCVARYPGYYNFHQLRYSYLRRRIKRKEPLLDTTRRIVVTLRTGYTIRPTDEWIATAAIHYCAAAFCF